MDTRQPRKTAAEREREGAFTAAGGVALIVLGYFLSMPLLLIGVLLAIVGLVTWGAAMARRD